MTAPTTAPAGSVAGSLLAPAYRATTAGLVLVVTLVAFEAMAVATAMPTAVRELRGLAYYSWPFTAFLVSSVIAMVLAGERSDRGGPRSVILTGLAVFAAGLLIAGTAHGMAVFVAGRAVQGLGAGSLVVAIYVVIAEIFSDAMRPRVFAVVSAAWVLPALVGPVIAGLLTEHLTWRLVFLGLVPLVAVGLVLVHPALRRLPGHDPEGTLGRRRLVPYAVLVAAGLAALQYAGLLLGRAGRAGQGGADPGVASPGGTGRLAGVLLALAGLAVLTPALRRMLPAGTLLLRQGLPAALAYRGLLAGAFFGADAFIPLTLSQVHQYGAAAAGVPADGRCAGLVGRVVVAGTPPGRAAAPAGPSRLCAHHGGHRRAGRGGLGRCAGLAGRRAVDGRRGRHGAVDGQRLRAGAAAVPAGRARGERRRATDL
ncbi:MAG TPA: MFS transporter [Mycobacteriales bacterium]|nr:MFS transporter [Mycobacteriales bacterium]